jgi:TrmH RNA methyltransferase
LSARAIPLAQAERPGRMILLLGNESDGLPETQLRHADELVVIPMAERIDSLNVGIAAGILLHHYAHAARVRR